MKKTCSFCGRSEKDVLLMITGINGNICNICTEQAYKILQESTASATRKKEEKAAKDLKVPKPKEIKAYLTNMSLVRTMPSDSFPWRCIITTSA